MGQIVRPAKIFLAHCGGPQHDAAVAIINARTRDLTHWPTERGDGLGHSAQACRVDQVDSFAGMAGVSPDALCKWSHSECRKLQLPGTTATAAGPRTHHLPRRQRRTDPLSGDSAIGRVSEHMLRELDAEPNGKGTNSDGQALIAVPVVEYRDPRIRVFL